MGVGNPMSGTYLSLALLARDPEGAATLERALRSVLERPDGPMFDEIVVLLGGRPNEKCREIIHDLADEFMGQTPSASEFWRLYELPPDIPLTEGGGLADFAAARNYLYSQCRGAWIGYIDADDIVPSAEAATVADKGAAGSVERGQGTLKGFLQSLPHAFNSVTFAYHYAHDHLGNVVVESYREWVRWRDGFTWVNRAPGHHEAIFPVYPNVRNVAELKGFYLEHRPPEGAAEKRLLRNDALLAGAQYIGLTDQWGVTYYLARQAERRNLYDLAIQHGEECVRLARNDEEKYTSLHGLARVRRCAGLYVAATTSALLAYNIGPSRGEAIADMVCIHLETGDPGRAVEWYARLLALPKAGAQLGIEYNAYEVDLWPHVAASRAFLAIERFDEAVEAAKRAVAFASYDVGAQRALADAEAARDLRRARDAARFLLEYAARRDDARRVKVLAEHLPYVLEHDHEIAATVAKAEAASEPIRDQGLTSRRLLANDTDVNIAVPYGTATDGTVTRTSVYTPERLLRTFGKHRFIERLERVPSDDADLYREGVIVASVVLLDDRIEVVAGPRVVFFCPEYVEPWGPWSPERTGIGGSEEMVIQVARRLASEGADVTVYAPVDDLCVDHNVVWRPFQTFDPDAPCDVLISHRTAHLARRPKLGAKVHYAWLHDAVVTRMAEDYEEARRSRVKGYLTLSEWQEQEYATRYGIPREQMIRVPNTPDPEDGLPEYETLLPTLSRGRCDVCGTCSHCGTAWKGRGLPEFHALCGHSHTKACESCGHGRRAPNRAVYASAPYRGLDILLQLWPLVREKIPDAELLCCGDWRVHDALTRVYPELARLKEAILQHQKAPGVVWRGKLTAPALREVFQTSNVLVYPTTFCETSCRTAIRAMACGCVPIYRPLAALEETIGTLGVAVPGDCGKPEYLQAFADAIVAEMLAPLTPERRRAMSEDTIKRHDPWETWRKVAGLERELHAGCVVRAIR